MNDYTVSLGYEGATDTALMLSDGVTSLHFAVESDGWRVLNVVGQGIWTPDHDKWYVLDLLWNHYNVEDLL